LGGLSGRQDVIARGCLFNDTYVLQNGTFSNVLGTTLGLEDWQVGLKDAGQLLPMMGRPSDVFL
jgi:hypothetical protein